MLFYPPLLTFVIIIGTLHPNAIQPPYSGTELRDRIEGNIPGGYRMWSVSPCFTLHPVTDNSQGKDTPQNHIDSTQPSSKEEDSIEVPECFLNWKPHSSVLLCFVQNRLIEFPRKRAISLPDMNVVEYVRWNHHATRFIIGNKGNAVVIDYASFKVIQKIDGLSAWWDGEQVSSISGSWLKGNLRLNERGKHYPLPAQRNLTATSEDGRWIMGWVYHKKREDMMGTLFLWRNLGGGRLQHFATLLKDSPLSEERAGDFVIYNRLQREIVFGLTSVTFSDPSWVRPFRYRLGTKRAMALWEDRDNAPNWYTAPPMAYSGGKVVGIRRTWENDSHGQIVGYLSQEFQYARGQTHYDNIRNKVMAFAVSAEGRQKAYLLHKDGNLVLVMLRDNRFWSAELITQPTG